MILQVGAALLRPLVEDDREPGQGGELVRWRRRRWRRLKRRVDDTVGDVRGGDKSPDPGGERFGAKLDFYGTNVRLEEVCLFWGLDDARANAGSVTEAGG